MFRKIFVLFMSPFLLFILPSPVVTAKPRPPLQLTLRHGSLSGEEVRLTLKARANVASDRVTLSIDLPHGISILEGEAAWEGPLKRGETRKIEVTIPNPGDPHQEITGRATIQFTGGGTFVQENRLRFNRSEQERPSPPDPITRKESGETILEFRGK